MRFGEYLVRERLVSGTDLELALEEQRGALAHRFLGEIFVHKELLSAEDLERAVDGYLRELGGGLDSTRLGDLLVLAGSITPAQLETALAAQRAAKGPRFIGEILVDMEIISLRQLEVFLANQRVLQAARDAEL